MPHFLLRILAPFRLPITFPFLAKLGEDTKFLSGL